jgi:hypothetical protein
MRNWTILLLRKVQDEIRADPELWREAALVAAMWIAVVLLSIRLWQGFC